VWTLQKGLYEETEIFWKGLYVRVFAALHQSEVNIGTTAWRYP